MCSVSIFFGENSVHVLELCRVRTTKTTDEIKLENLSRCNDTPTHAVMPIITLTFDLFDFRVNIQAEFDYRPRSREDNTFGSVRVCPFVCGRSPV